ncbi:hypothetical protein IAU59_006738 [Kwoniella sp. CBS 9459]
MRSVVLICAIFAFLSLVAAVPIPEPLSPKDMLDRALSHRLAIAKDTHRAHLAQTSSNSSEAQPSQLHNDRQKTSDKDNTKGTEMETEGTRSPGLVVQGQVTQDQDARVWAKRFTEKEAWDAASWIWG